MHLTSPSRKSGLGDHGSKGIQDFINSHSCNHICQGLGLESKQVLQDTFDDLLQEVGDLFGDLEDCASQSKGSFHAFAPSEDM